MRKVSSIFLGLSALVLMGSASANAKVNSVGTDAQGVGRDPPVVDSPGVDPPGSLVGTDVTITYLSPNVTSVFAGPTVLPITTDPTTLVCPAFGSGVCGAFVENASITIGAASFTVNENSGSSYATEPFNGIEFSNLDFGPGERITGFTLLTNLPGLTAADVSFTNDSIMYNGSGLSFETSPYFITLTVTTVVPELSTWAMMIFGFAGLGLVGYRASRRPEPIE
jgi:hypothetical protein